MTLTINRAWIQVRLLLRALAGNKLNAQSEPHHRTPFSYEVNLGGVTPAGTTKSGPYSSSVLIGGGVSLPLGKWASLDFASMDFGFGTTNQTQTIQAIKAKKKTKKNY